MVDPYPDNWFQRCLDLARSSRVVCDRNILILALLIFRSTQLIQSRVA